jgi:hypothetical protein
MSTILGQDTASMVNGQRKKKALTGGRVEETGGGDMSILLTAEERCLI